MNSFQWSIFPKGAFARAFFSLAKTNCHRNYGKVFAFKESLLMYFFFQIIFAVMFT